MEKVFRLLYGGSFAKVGFQICAAQSGDSPSGSCFHADNSRCVGRCWLYDGGTFFIAKLDAVFREDVVFTFDLPNGIRVIRDEFEPVSSTDPRSSPHGQPVKIIVSHESPATMAFPKDTHIRLSEFFLTLDFVKCCPQIGCPHRFLRTLSQKNAVFLSAEQLILFRQAMHCGLSRGAARLYYECKARELLALIADRVCVETSACSRCAEDSDCVFALKSYIDEHYAEPLTIERLSKWACMSASNLKQRFRDAFGLPVYQYIIALRIERAVRLLRDTNLPITQVAARVGYLKASAFAAVFKKHTGVSPRDFRNRSGNSCEPE